MNRTILFLVAVCFSWTCTRKVAACRIGTGRNEPRIRQVKRIMSYGEAEAEIRKNVNSNARSEPQLVKVNVVQPWWRTVLDTLAGIGTFGAIFALLIAVHSTRIAEKGVRAAEDGVKAAIKSAKATEMSAEGQLFLQQLRDYGSPEMLEHLRTIWEWATNPKGGRRSASELNKKASIWVRDLFSKGDSQKKKKAAKIDLARRHITAHFLTVLHLKRSRYVKGPFLKEIGQVMGDPRILDVILPLSKALIKDIGAKDKKSATQIKEEINSIQKKFEEVKKILK